MVPQETQCSFTKLQCLLKGIFFFFCSQYLYVHLSIVLRFPKKLCIGSQNVFSQRFMKPFFSLPHILITKFWKQLQKYCVASRNIASLAKLLRLHAKVLHSPEELCIALAKILFAKSDAIPPRNFAFACKTFSISSKTFAFSRKYNLWFYLIFPSQTYCEQTQKLA